MEYYLFKAIKGKSEKEVLELLLNDEKVNALSPRKWRWQRHEIIEQIYWGRHGFDVHDMIDQIDISSEVHKMDIHVWKNRVKVVGNKQELTNDNNDQSEANMHNSPAFFLYALHKSTGYIVYDKINDKVIDMKQYSNFHSSVTGEALHILWSKPAMKIWTLGIALSIAGVVLHQEMLGVTGFVTCIFFERFISKISKEVNVVDRAA